jgi:putative transposase
VFRILQIERSTYYAHLKAKENERLSISAKGRPIPGYSYTQDGSYVSDEQIREWIMELLEGEGASYGYRKITVRLKRSY